MEATPASSTSWEGIGPEFFFYKIKGVDLIFLGSTGMNSEPN